MTDSAPVPASLDKYRDGPGPDSRGYPDLHDHVLELARKGLLHVIEEPINKDTEMHPLVRWQYRGGIPEAQRKAFLFTHPTDGKGRKFDCAVLVAGMHATRRIMNAPSMRQYIVRERDPGEACVSDADMLDHVRAKGGISYHPVGTCMRGSGSHAVVDARLRVHGIAGLRVIDASIMPTLVSGNTNAPTIMIAEKGADMVLADANA